jgi:hypothetical protein
VGQPTTRRPVIVASPPPRQSPSLPWSVSIQRDDSSAHLVSLSCSRSDRKTACLASSPSPPSTWNEIAMSSPPSRPSRSHRAKHSVSSLGSTRISLSR